ncbi:hypothetical protein LCI18_011244 [Fusarium solani-melongenae]|uniref:Uncharacterized protein n=1 Tax=Fusarium solani subsp. cucurbitae TaxID=2747967 RepID=A0ACD3ZG92_FUSSC|nr:hypothetical protein LCI18_011244 [Fusarium solani-melongenae]
MASAFDINNLFNVNGLIAVVTGGGSGIGLMISQALEANGAIVYIIGRRKDVLRSASSTAATDPEQKHGNIHPIQGDITNKKDLERAVSKIESSHGYVNVVIANADIGGPSLTKLPDTFTINTVGVLNTVFAFLELLDAGNKKGNLKQRSQVIATSSIGGFNRSPALGYAYGGSKAAVTHIFKQLSTSLGQFNIRANVIAPGFYPSEMTTEAIEYRKTAGWPKSVVPEERPGDEEDVAGAVLFLVSRAGAYINGNVLVTDGGRLGVVPASY